MVAEVTNGCDHTALLGKLDVGLLDVVREMALVCWAV